MRVHVQRVVCVFLGVLLAVLAWPAAGVDLEVVGEGHWETLGEAPEVVWQGNPEGETSAVCPDAGGSGAVWRCFVEPSPETVEAGLWFAATQDLSSGFLLTLGGTPDVGGVALRDAGGAVLWQDKYAPWQCYTPYVLEGVVEPGRVRVQMLAWDRKTLLAQSDWIDAPQAKSRNGSDSSRYLTDAVLAFYTKAGAARFYRWRRAEQALSPIVADSPTKLRLITDEDSPWVIVGPGDWKWTSAAHRVLRQGAKVERSTALNRDLGGAEGTWRCRVRVDEGAGGSGMAMAADDSLKTGFLVWLGGRYGDGGLMLYRLPLEALWSSPQGQWHYDTEYVLEGKIANGKVSARMLEADGETVIAASPEFDLTQEEKGRSGFVGFQTWKGTAQFWDFSEQTRAEASARVAQAAPSRLGKKWLILDGDWGWADKSATMLQQNGEAGAAINLELSGARCVFRGRVNPADGAKSASLLFQVSRDLKEGFECKLGQGLRLESLDGRTLWQRDDFEWRPREAYILEGIVITDRVLIRAYDSKGNLLVESDQCFISDANNTRVGHLGFRSEGPAEFSNWSVEPSNE